MSDAGDVRPPARVAPCLVTSLIVAFAASVAAGAPLGLLSFVSEFAGWQAVELGGLTPFPAWLSQPERLVTYAFVHAGIQHLGANLMLAGLTIHLERDVGSAALGIVLLSSVVGGALLSAALPEGFVVVGASAGCFGLIATDVVLLARRRDELPSPRRHSHPLVPIVLFLALGWLVILIPFIAHFAHLGGFLIGGALSALAIRGRTLEQLRSDPPRWIRRGAAASLVIVLLAVGTGLVRAIGFARESAIVSATRVLEELDDPAAVVGAASALAHLEGAGPEALVLALEGVRGLTDAQRGDRRLSRLDLAELEQELSAALRARTTPASPPAP